MAVIERGVQRVKVDDLSTPCVDDDRTLWQERQFARADEVACFCSEFRDEHKDLAQREHGVEVGYQLYTGEACDAGVDVGIIGKHRAIEAILEFTRDLRADVAETHDPHGLALELNDLQAGAPGPGRAIAHPLVPP